ncbi:MAG: YtxH domain-containing protein [Candidatus Promineifilaceae bacterium]|nr:YtxH domain-containing protein [Candidatus Promineifilaceae bacterium]
MQKFFSFVAGLMSGSIVGAAAALLLAPASGEELRQEAQARWEEALDEAKKAMEETRLQKEREYQMMKEAGKPR